MDALTAPYWRRKPSDTVYLHPDQVSQYGSRSFRKLFNTLNVEPNMNRRGNSWDNAVAESFFSNLKKEKIRRIKYKTRDDARQVRFFITSKCSTIRNVVIMPTDARLQQSMIGSILGTWKVSRILRSYQNLHQSFLLTWSISQKLKPHQRSCSAIIRRILKIPTSMLFIATLMLMTVLFWMHVVLLSESRNGRVSNLDIT